ncbi:somatostatin-2-like isoform X2 [Thunnus thynnus]|uniref:somatostatin-2-like isoform X2 n=1 Tax=Thunnus thynnus TaxID=8237 RepID=UPI003527A508
MGAGEEGPEPSKEQHREEQQQSQDQDQDQNQDQYQDQDQKNQNRTRTEPDQQTARSSFSPSNIPADMQCVRCPAILVLVALVLGVSSQPDRDQDEYQNQDLELELRHHRLLQRARNAGLLSQEWSKRAVEDLLAQMSLPEADAQREAEVVSMETGGKMNLERSVDPPNNLPPRERKAGCKNFYWKGFTSC